MTQPAPVRPDATPPSADRPTATEPSVRGRSVRRRVTTGTGATLALAVASVTGAATAHADEQYTVRAGDTVSHIALRSGTSVGAIARANSLPSAGAIRIGQTLTIPSATAPAAAPAPAAPAATGTYTVRSGDTVSGIAAQHRTTVAAVVAANGLDARALIRIGQRLTIPGAAGATAPAPAPAPAAPAATGTYTVRSGDTVSGIAAQHRTTVAAVVAANGLDARASIRIGQKLRLPGATAPAATPTTQLVGNTFAGRTYSSSVVASANLNKATLLAMGVPSKSAMQAKVVSTARALGVDPALAQAIAFQESGFNQTAVSPANAIGTMQCIPSTGVWVGQMVGRPLNLLDPDDNVTCGVGLLRHLVRTSPDLPTAIAGYYQGAASVKRNGMFTDTRRYVAAIQTHMTRFR